MYLSKGKLRLPSFTSFRAKVMAVIDADRGSTMKPGSVKKLQRKAEEAVFKNEDELLLDILPTVIKNTRLVQRADPNDLCNSITTVEDYEDSGLKLSINNEFRRNCLPNAFVGLGYDDKIARSLAKKQGVKNPKPDRAYGLDPDKYALPRGQQLCASTHELLDVAPNNRDVFFVIEGKSSNGDMGTAALQCLRGTTALVASQRTLLMQTGQLGADGGGEGPDDDTFVYGCTMDAATMQFWVTFACVEAAAAGSKDTGYYMEHIATKAYQDGAEAPAMMRRICHNILDWGVQARQATLQKRWVAIYTYDLAWMTREAARKRREAADEREASPSKKQRRGHASSSAAAID